MPILALSTRNMVFSISIPLRWVQCGTYNFFVRNSTGPTCTNENYFYSVYKRELVHFGLRVRKSSVAEVMTRSQHLGTSSQRYDTDINIIFGAAQFYHNSVRGTNGFMETAVYGTWQICASHTFVRCRTDVCKHFISPEIVPNSINIKYAIIHCL